MERPLSRVLGPLGPIECVGSPREQVRPPKTLAGRARGSLSQSSQPCVHPGVKSRVDCRLRGQGHTERFPTPDPQTHAARTRLLGHQNRRLRGGWAGAHPPGGSGAACPEPGLLWQPCIVPPPRESGESLFPGERAQPGWGRGGHVAWQEGARAFPFSQPAWAVPPACCSQVLPLPGCCAQGPRCASLEPESSSVPPLLAVPRAPPAWGSLHSCEAVRPLDRDRPLCPVALGSEGPVVRHSSQLGVPGAASHTARAGTPGAGLRPPAQRRWA